MAPSVSVLIRLYNGIEYLDDALRSVISQTYHDFEVLVGVNGHGPDGGDVYRKAIQISYSMQDPRIHVINYPNVRGGAEVMNALAKDATAEWIAILDVDDKWHRDKLSIQTTMISYLTPTPDVIGTQCQYFDAASGMPNIPLGFIDLNHFKTENPMINSSVVMRRGLMDFTDRFNLDDYDLWCRLALQNKVFFNVKNILTFHRINPNSYYNASKKQDPDALRRHYFPT